MKHTPRNYDSAVCSCIILCLHGQKIGDQFLCVYLVFETPRTFNLLLVIWIPFLLSDGNSIQVFIQLPVLYITTQSFFYFTAPSNWLRFCSTDWVTSSFDKWIKPKTMSDSSSMKYGNRSLKVASILLMEMWSTITDGLINHGRDSIALCCVVEFAFINTHTEAQNLSTNVVRQHKSTACVLAKHQHT